MLLNKKLRENIWDTKGGSPLSTELKMHYSEYNWSKSKGTILTAKGTMGLPTQKSDI